MVICQGLSGDGGYGDTECRVFPHNLRVGSGTRAFPVWEKHESYISFSDGGG